MSKMAFTFLQEVRAQILIVFRCLFWIISFLIPLISSQITSEIILLFLLSSVLIQILSEISGLKREISEMFLRS